MDEMKLTWWGDPTIERVPGFQDVHQGGLVQEAA
jgi:hypothetical protein